MIILILSVFLSFFNLYANDPSDIDIDRRLFMPRTLGLSGNMGARINLNESLYINPASSAHSKCFSIDGGYGWNSTSFFDNRIDNFYINAIDTDSDFLGGGAGFYKRRVKGGEGTEWEVRGIINRTMLRNRMAMGIGFSYLSYNYYGKSDNNLNLDFGLMYLLLRKTIVGMTVYNLIGDKKDLRTRSIDFSIRQTFWDFFSTSLSLEHRFDKKINVTGAMELLYKNGMMVTISGRRSQHLKNNFWGLGLGYVAPKISFLYGTMNAMNYPYNFHHSFSIRMFF